ncbi:hypothetical protein JTB14_032176 [Gonioctena quinquepunctata]|nr:hypothetical protein JTB14_032176 [Gonioctena quinquepunctata]
MTQASENFILNEKKVMVFLKPLKQKSMDEREVTNTKIKIENAKKTWQVRRRNRKMCEIVEKAAEAMNKNEENDMRSFGVEAFEKHIDEEVVRKIKEKQEEILNELKGYENIFG